MAKKSKKMSEVKKYAGKTEEEWRDWGEEFGKSLDKGGRRFTDEMEGLGDRIRRHVASHREEWRENFGEDIEKGSEDFGEEMEDWGERFGRRMERRGKLWRRRWEHWWFGTFSFIAPLLGSIFGMILLLLGILALNLINITLKSQFIFAVSNFLIANLYLFFAVSLLLGYGRYLSRRNHAFWILRPLISSVSMIFVVWVAAFVIDSIGLYSGSGSAIAVANFIYLNLWGIFAVLVVLAYAFAIFRMLIMDLFYP